MEVVRAVMFQTGESWDSECTAVTESGTLGLSLLWCHRERNSGVVAAVVSLRGKHWACLCCAVMERSTLELTLL